MSTRSGGGAATWRFQAGFSETTGWFSGIASTMEVVFLATFSSDEGFSCVKVVSTSVFLAKKCAGIMNELDFFFQPQIR